MSVAVFQWHLGMFAKEYTPLYRGFESHFGYYQGCEDYYDHTYEADLVSGDCYDHTYEADPVSGDCYDHTYEADLVSGD